MNIFKPLFQIFGICLHDWSEYGETKSVDMLMVMHKTGKVVEYREWRQYRSCTDCNFTEYRVVEGK